MSEEDKEKENARRRMLWVNKSEEDRLELNAAERERKKEEKDRKSLEDWKADCQADRERKKEERDRKSFEDRKADCEADRERKKEKRDRKSFEDWKADCEADRERKNEERDRKSFEDWKADCEADRERKKDERDRKTFEEWKADCEADKVRKKYEREQRDESINDFEKISLKHQKRDNRKERTGKEKLMQNLESKKGMRLLREKGRLKDFKERINRNTHQETDWKNFIQKSEKHAAMAVKIKPDIVQRVNEMLRDEKELLRRQKVKEYANERIRKEKVAEDGGEWVFDKEYSDYYWVGEGEPPVVEEQPIYKPLSEQQLQSIKKQEEEWLKAAIEEREREKQEKRRKKYEELQALKNTPISPLPEKDLCEYEKLREKNIKEREQAMLESGFFEDFNDYKKKIGLC